MAKKESIKANIEQYDNKEGVEALCSLIQKGELTLEELKEWTQGGNTSILKNVTNRLQSGDDDMWARCMSGGTPTMESLNMYLSVYPTGKHVAEANKLMAEAAAGQERQSINNEARAAWFAVDKGSMDQLRNFLKYYGNSQYAPEANNAITALYKRGNLNDEQLLVKAIKKIESSGATREQKNNAVEKEIRKYNDKGVLLTALSHDHNLLSAGLVRTLVNANYIGLDDLHYIGIKDEFITIIAQDDAEAGNVQFDVRQLPESISKECTEIYFWGVPSSGKSCALGAILSVADEIATVKPDNKAQGYGYMQEIKLLFQPGKVGRLMQSTQKNAFYAMGFDLTDEDGRIHPITCVDLAGELMRCMYKMDAGKLSQATVQANNEPDDDDDSDGDEGTTISSSMATTLSDDKLLKKVSDLFSDKTYGNRKIHVFVIDYGSAGKLYEGYPQRTYLEGALAYIEATGIFKKSTDAVFIMVTKADKDKFKNMGAELSKFIEDEYGGFYKNLKRICKDCDINGGSVDRIPFTLGDVCFQDYCLFDPEAAENVVRILLVGRTASKRKGRIAKLGNMFRR